MSGIHALIIEDHHDSVDVLGRLLELEHIDFVAVMRPRALNPADLDSIDVVFLDLDMPEMNGFEVFQMLRQQFGVTVPIIAYTVNTNEKATARKMGFNGMISKPIDASCFHEQLVHILDGEAMWEEC